jgi:peptidoglycan/xylan/chitin deacetylase (PgdA/CDA1 family)
MQTLAAAGWRTLTLAEFADTICGVRQPAPRELVITFDDAYRGLRDHAFPVLRDLGFSAACFVITEYAGRLNRWDVAYGGRRFAHLAWRDVERWSARGIEFGSHSATHPRLAWLDEARLSAELSGSRAALAATLGTAPAAIAYPFGATDERVTRAAAACGYSLGFGLGARWTGDPMCVPREAVHCWSPTLPVVGRLGVVERFVSRAACRCSIGTALWQRLTNCAGVIPSGAPKARRRGIATIPSEGRAHPRIQRQR